CALKKQGISSCDSSFYIDHQFSLRIGSGILLDDESGLVRRTEPPDKEYFSDRGSYKSVDVSVGNDVVHRRVNSKDSAYSLQIWIL
ncbi:unnamed protein product, partial [Ilex paraguariensis]